MCCELRITKVSLIKIDWCLTWYPIYFCTYSTEEEGFYTKNKDSYRKRKVERFIKYA